VLNLRGVVAVAAKVLHTAQEMEIKMKLASFLMLMLNLAVGLLIAQSQPSAPPSNAPANILPNPSFESTEPPVPTAQTAKTGAPSDHWMPRTWEVSISQGATYRCPDDAKQAHSGRRCVYFQTAGPGAVLRYGPLPVFDKQPWTASVWLRGKGTAVLSAFEYDSNQPFKRAEVPLTADWKQAQVQVSPPEKAQQWSVDIAHTGPVEMWIDDASVTHPALAPLMLPPNKPLGKDQHTLLYLPCEKAHEEKLEGNVRFITLDGFELIGAGKFELSKQGDGPFGGKSMGLWPGSSIFCSASQYLNPSSGTVEMWIKFRTARDDGISQHFVGVTGMNGMYFGKHVYGNLTLGFSNGWRGLCNTSVGMSPATTWQPGVWRHFVACWDKDALELFVDGKLVAWQTKPTLAKGLEDSLCIGGSNWGVDTGSFDFADLRISDIARYKFPLPNPTEKK
jgi:hypothetical protein